uniref:Ig-like domain-containing protein n=1 Tax=Poecilia latipinna TaxID=48699 RepID=A0A3B3V3H0_9TELE
RGKAGPSGRTINLCCVLEPAKIVEKAASISVTVGEPATLECSISGSPELKVRWFKDGKEMISGRKYKMTLKENTAVLKILSADRGDTSEYKMEVSNKVGKDDSVFGLSFHTDRAVPPSFTKTLKKMDGSIGSNATLECRVAGSQPMVVSWFKDDKEIHSDDKYKLDFSESAASVTITHLDQSDGGVYTCRASNKAGENETSGTLTVKAEAQVCMSNTICCFAGMLSHKIVQLVHLIVAEVTVEGFDLIL